jgi:hypothetical protein
MDVQLKYQTLYSCSVPKGFTAVKDFSEVIATDNEPTPEEILQTIKLSFERVGVEITSIELSSNNMCIVGIKGEEHKLIVTIRCRPSLVIGDKIYRLEEFDF